MTFKNAKKVVGYAAADLIEDGMSVGLGTGSTALFFIERLSERCRNGLRISALATSKTSHQIASQGGIPLIDIEGLKSLDITVDGADEIDQNQQMIKGGGGALLREKIAAAMSREMVVIVDSSKIKEYLGAFPLPVEILPFAHHATINHLNELGYEGQIRQTAENTPYFTDNGNLIYDIKLPYPCQNPHDDNRTIRSVPGVIETGFFLNMADRILVGYPDGEVKVISKNTREG